MFDLTTSQGAAESAAPSATDVAWAAGLFEGEGWITSRCDRRRPHLRHTQLGMQTTDEDVLMRFARVVGAGNVLPSKSSGGRNLHGSDPGTFKPSWMWQSAAIADVTRITQMLYPHLGQRRQQKIVDCLAADTRLA